MAWRYLNRSVRYLSLLFLLAVSVTNSYASNSSYNLQEITLNTIQGQSKTMADFEGKTLIVNFWASWCPPCVKELPDLQEMAENIDQTRYQVILISVDADPENGQQMLNKLDIKLPAFIDPKMEVANGHFRVLGFPETLIIKPSGEVFSRFLGPKEWANPEFWQKILP